jgi:riboflavin kinase/FMN adenylyltransferase
LTIGSFDGVHRGHQEIVQRLSEQAHAEGAEAVVLTFYPHPAAVLRGRDDPFYLTTPEERAHLLGIFGADVVITHSFNKDIANLSARDFLSRLAKHLDFRQLWVGYNFAMGKNREGDTDKLRILGNEFGYILKEIEPIQVGGQVVSSSRIREHLRAGKVEIAAILLNRPYQIEGKVIAGDGRGRTLGVPTANLDLWPMRILPKPGVYACHASINQKQWKAVTNIGVRPTFEQNTEKVHVETHILDFNDDIYGDQIELAFSSRLRDERRFPNIETLIKQIQNDISQARSQLST